MTIRAEGLILPIDAHPEMLHWTDGQLMRPRMQSFDSTFSTKNTDKITLAQASVATTHPERQGRGHVRRHAGLLGADDPADGT